MRSVGVLFFFLYCSCIANAIDEKKVHDYIDQYMAICVVEMHKYGIPASIKMAQAILESGAGQSELATRANNHFGMKCGGYWTGETFKKWDDETVKSCFRVYDHPDSSFTAHSRFLLNPKKAYRYGFLFDLNRFDYISWAKGLQSAGYATSKTYAKNLISIIERYRLYKLDFLDIQTIDLIPGFMTHVFPHDPNEQSKQMDTIFLTKVVNPYGADYDSIVVKMTMNQFVLNELPVVYVQLGDKLEDIAMRYRVRIKDLKKWNDLKGRKIMEGQVMYLTKKWRRYAFCRRIKTAAHIIKPSEELYDIAQLYGLQYRILQRITKQKRGVKLRVGSVLVLCPCLLKKR